MSLDLHLDQNMDQTTAAQLKTEFFWIIRISEIWGPDDGWKNRRTHTWNGSAVFWGVSAELQGSAKTLHTHTHRQLKESLTFN